MIFYCRGNENVILHAKSYRITEIRKRKIDVIVVRQCETCIRRCETVPSTRHDGESYKLNVNMGIINKTSRKMADGLFFNKG